MTDYTSGYVILKKEIVTARKLRGDYGEYFIDLVYSMNKNKRFVTEIPYIMKSRDFGESKTASNVLDYVTRGRKYIWTLLRCLFNKYANQS